LTEEHVEAIHRGTLSVLEGTGVRVEHERALKLLEKNGCKVDYDNRRVRIPQALAEECLRKCPSNCYIKARDPKSDLMIGGNTLYFNCCPGTMTMDLDTWETRRATLAEADDANKVLDALDNVHFAFTGGYTVIGDVPPEMGLLEGYTSAIRNTTKGVCATYCDDYEVFAIKMAKAIGIDMIGMMSAAPPLTYYADAVESGFRCAEAGFPLMVTSGQVLGGTGPVTQAGSAIANNAEMIAGVVLAQLMKPGLPVLACDFTFPMNMSSGEPACGSLGQAFHQAVFIQTWRRYGVPTWVVPGIINAKKIDFQNAYERTFSAVTAALLGANMLQLHGGGCAEILSHPVQSILDDDIAGMIGRFVEGIEVNHETLAVDLIDQVGPIPGYYLNKEHTRKWWEKEQFIPKVADMMSVGEWLKTGKRDAVDYAKNRMAEILETHKPKPLTPKEEQAIEDILKEAREYYEARKKIH
jgi:trimethylamine--corrinoid protein Co-methyltransferase